VTRRVLVVDGNVAAHRARQVASVGYDSGTGYAGVLRRIDPGLRVDVVTPSDGDARFPPGVALADYDGAAITGSALNVYHGGDPVLRQIDFVRQLFAAGVPVFGSCWGLQVAVTAAGGEVRANPRGREYGFGRRITLTERGREHPLFADKPAVFEAPTIHRDEISALPTGAQVLAVNEYGLQAAAFVCGTSTFWGVQYHPEYDYLDIAGAGERYGRILVEDGMFDDFEALATFTREMRALKADPDNAPLLWRHGLGTAIRDERIRTLEIRNWLERSVGARAAGARVNALAP
jgi:GMP synthase (glutamine-hydrolysing)